MFRQIVESLYILALPEIVARQFKFELPCRSIRERVWVELEISSCIEMKGEIKPSSMIKEELIKLTRKR